MGAKATEHKSILRIDRPDQNMHGYEVRLFWKGRCHTRWFSDKLYRGQALYRAVLWRNATEHAFGKPRSPEKVNPGRPRGARNKPKE